VASKFAQRKFPVPLPPSSVLITGADTGFGHMSSLEMARLGYRVFSGVLSEASGEELKRKFSEMKKEVDGGSITPLVFDVTNDQQLSSAFQTLSTELKDSGLQLLLNNAGIARLGPIELVPFTDVRKVVEVNLLGHMRVAQLSLPLMRKAKAPRIVNLTSVAGRVAAPQMSAYNASKFGMEGVTDSMRSELRHLGFSVSAIEPGFIKTPILTSADAQLDKMWEEANEDQKKAYRRYWDGREEAQKTMREKASDPEIVVAAIRHAFTSETPQPRYLVGTDAKIFGFVHWLLPEFIFDHLSSMLIPVGKD